MDDDFNMAMEIAALYARGRPSSTLDQGLVDKINIILSVQNVPQDKKERPLGNQDSFGGQDALSDHESFIDQSKPTKPEDVKYVAHCLLPSIVKRYWSRKQ